MKKTLVSALTTALVVGAASTTFAATNPFSDVPADHWAYDAVSQLAADGVIEGYGDTTFRGNQNITRYEMAQMIAKAMAKPDVSASDKALIDKLAAEFSDELNTLGVRVSNLERNADKVKWNGEARYTYTSTRDKSKADSKSRNDLLHDAAVRMAGMLAQAALVDGPDLFEQNDGVLREAHIVAGQRNVRRQTRLAHAAGNGGGDNRGAVLVAHIVLNYENGSHAALLRTYHRT